ncbi:DUF2079 domain-containing protein [Aulosira sp. FACHB-615]|uniref:DUF2079 domain-containing protein n=1 Tax=Aulosira sp. FACHB-615 TaxID=2692777 RepID=UPI0016884B85|nr:DUF2079 domain-containing protein [Aulosira sp. FACHB-615]MBD2488952.1 DUF2079 domain-containing protein [Aulosira sp. FACHB-615]
MRSPANQTIFWIIGINALILFVCSSIRHNLFQSASADLGIFDQVVYLISQGEKPISSLLGFHILGDHAAWLWYPLGLLYKIYPDVHWLFAVQSVVLSSGALPIALLGKQAGLKKEISLAVAIAYLLYPLLFNINLYDFHLDVIIPSAILWATWAARNRKYWLFCGSIIIVLGCKAVFALTIAAMGIWLIFFEKRRLYGLTALLGGISWFAIATQVIIPYFGGSAASLERHIHRYSHLGNSFSEIAKNLFFSPGLFFHNLFSLENLFYLFLLVIPVVWGLSLSSMAPLVGAIPCLGINLLADSLQQKDLFFQYSLPIVPFMFLAVMQTLVYGRGLLQTKKAIILWALVAFLALAKYGYFWSIYLKSFDTWSAMREAIALVKTPAGVYTTAEITPHLTHRKIIQFTNANLPEQDLSKFNYILLNVRHPGWLSNQNFVNSLIIKLQNNPQFVLAYQRDDVYLFTKS